MLRPIINTFIAPLGGGPGHPEGLFEALTALAVIFVAVVIANYAQARIMLTVAQNALQKIRNDLFGKMQKLPVRFYDTNSSGDLMSRFTNDVDTIGQMLSLSLIHISFTPPCPISVSYPWVKEVTNPAAWALAAISRISSSVASSLPQRRFSSMVPENRTFFCRTMPTPWRRCLREYSLTSTPSTRTWPCEMCIRDSL